MVHNKIVEEILRKSLGPYNDYDVLHETACQMKGTNKLVLYSFMLEHNGYIVGLDESERPLPTDNRLFRFRGVLKIAHPSWLSEFGLKIVETELNLRAKEFAMREGRGRVPQFTVEDLFSDHLSTSSDATFGKDETRLMILIQGEKNLPATFMDAGSCIPNGMQWNTKAHKRNFQVATMDVATYARSQNFFWQWRLFALMKKICDRYSYIPEKKRTPRWFVEKYITDFACTAQDKHQRLLFDPSDPDVDETGKTVTPRHLLQPHMSEILGLFAAQAGWLITNNVLMRQKLFDTGTWERFRKEARRQRREAAARGVRWGCPEGEEGEVSLSEGSESEADLVRKHPVTGKENVIVARKIELSRNKSDKLNESSDSDNDWDANGGGNDYASDFSEQSNMEEEDSDDWLAEEDAVNQIPWQLRLPPHLPDVDGWWWCPLQECGYKIDLNEITQEEEKKMSRETAGYILQKRWKNAAYDEKCIEGFRRLVTNHYVEHFEKRGVRAERKEGRIRFVLINGRQRRHTGDEPVRGPMPARGTLGGEARVIPTVHVTQAAHFQ